MPKGKTPPKGKTRTGAPRQRAPGAGRPLTITPAVQDSLVSYLSAGNFLDTSCHLVGIPLGTVKQWIREGNKELRAREKGKDPDPERETHAQFATAVRKASAEAVARNITNINLIARGQPAREVIRERTLPDGTVERTIEKTAAVPAQWTASAWFLERTQHEKFGRRPLHRAEGGEDRLPPQQLPNGAIPPAGSAVPDSVSAVEVLARRLEAVASRLPREGGPEATPA